MRKPGFTTAHTLFGVLAATLLGAAVLAAPAAGWASSSTCASSAKCFAVTVSPASPVTGATTSFAFAITNESASQPLGSVQISAPAGFVITSAPDSASFTSGSALFLNLSLAPSATTTLIVNAVVPCDGGTYQWGIDAQRSTDFSGSPGNAFQLDSASTRNLSGTPTGSCSLTFASDGQPTGTAVDEAISSGFGSRGGPVKVAVLDGSGQLVTSSTAAVTVSIGSNPNAGSLSGTVTADASGGVASFSDLSIDQPGIGYTLTATSPRITPVTSANFTIWGSLLTCSTTPCSASSSTDSTTGTVTTSSATQTDLLGSSIGGANYDCGPTYQPVSGPFSFDVLDLSGTPQSTAQFAAELRISKSTVQGSGHLGAASWQICYASTTSFQARPDTAGMTVIGQVRYFTGLLPDCSSSQDAPCVQARNKNNAGDVIVSFLASGDPIARG